MEQLKAKYNKLCSAIDRLQDAILLYEKAEQKQIGVREEMEDLVALGLRDSMIQRFEYSVDLLWKHLNRYLEVVIKRKPELLGPKHIVRMCSTVNLITETESPALIEMLDYRNQISHIYKEELAILVAKNIPNFLVLMQAVLEKSKPASSY